MFFATAFLFLISVASCDLHAVEDEKIYRGAQVWRTDLKGADDILLIKKLIDNKDVSIWKLSPFQADYLVYFENKVRVHRQLKTRKLSHSVLIMDVQRRVNSLKSEPALWDENSLRIGHRLDWNSYPTLKIIDEYFNYLADNYPSLCRLQAIGRTAENRSIQMLNISNGNPANKMIIVTAGIHGREWVSITSALYIINEVITKFDRQPDYIKNKNWLVIPVVNPDGYEFSHTTNRLWRKNRKVFHECKGVDINRNFEIDWGVVGITVNNPCGESYSGPFPFSEAESLALRYLLLKITKTPSALVDLHSYGQLILFPWSARSKAANHAKQLKEGAQAIAQGIFNNTQQRYEFGQTYHKIYPATGALIDWAYSSGVLNSFAIETRDTGAHGFLLPPKYIHETGMEVFAGVKKLSKGLDIVNRIRNDDVWL